MERDEVIKRLCKLAYDVMVRHFSARIPADCFCGQAELRGLGCADFQFDETVLLFIEQAVEDAVAAKYAREG